ncbi:terminase small subunit [Aerococcus urinae]|uniref:terminase small subunit n=1 Tax=Aerococcus urinae TaxID=1376 RepID=UPI003F7B5DCF
MSGNATEAALKAGYSKSSARNIGHENLTKPDIKAYIDKRLNKLEKDKIASADEVLQTLTAILRQELMEEQEVVNPVSGQIVTLKQKPTVKDVINAGKELMKRYPTTLETKKLKLEIEKLQEQIGGSEGQDDKIAGYINLLKEGVQDDK